MESADLVIFSLRDWPALYEMNKPTKIIKTPVKVKKVGVKSPFTEWVNNGKNEPKTTLKLILMTNANPIPIRSNAHAKPIWPHPNKKPPRANTPKVPFGILEQKFIICPILGL